jgi:hypothetical protein
VADKSKCPTHACISHRWQTEHALVLAGELGDAFVADFELPGLPAPNPDHPPPRLEQPLLFLELHRRERGDGAEMLVKAWHAHAGHSGEAL